VSCRRIASSVTLGTIFCTHSTFSFAESSRKRVHACLYRDQPIRSRDAIDQWKRPLKLQAGASRGLLVRHSCRYPIRLPALAQCRRDESVYGNGFPQRGGEGSAEERREISRGSRDPPLPPFPPNYLNHLPSRRGVHLPRFTNSHVIFTRARNRRTRLL